MTAPLITDPNQIVWLSDVVASAGVVVIGAEIPSGRLFHVGANVTRFGLSKDRPIESLFDVYHPTEHAEVADTLLLAAQGRGAVTRGLRRLRVDRERWAIETATGLEIQDRGSVWLGLLSEYSPAAAHGPPPVIPMAGQLPSLPAAPRWESWIGLDGAPRWIGSAAALVTGYSVAELMGMTSFPTPLIHAEDQSLIAGYLTDALRGGSAREVQFRIVTKEGEVRWVQMSYEPVFAADGICTGFCAVVDEAPEPAPIDVRLELERRAIDAGRLESLGQIAPRVAHDCNNFLMVVLGHSDLISASVTAGEPLVGQSIKEDADQASLAARGAGELMRQLLDFAKRGTAQPGPIRIDTLIKDMAILLKVAVRKPTQLLLPDFPAATVEADPAQLRQLIMSLILTAAQSITDDRGRIRLGLTIRDLTDADRERFPPPGSLEPGRFAIVEIADNGRGARSDLKNRIVDPLSTVRLEPLGFGLSIAQRIARRHRGGIEVVGTGAGTTCRLALPLAVT